MVQQIQNPPIAAVVIRWVTRVLTIISIGILLLFFIGEADFNQSVQLTLGVVIGKMFFPVGVVIGMVVGWWREGPGAAITVISLLAFYVFDLVVTGTFPSGPFFVLFALPGILFGLSWLLGRQGQ